ncbi:MAG: DUF2097 domain-containing protein [Methanobacteriaceae archaeon]|nr:DUF2097 domain-containing protein [Methanobacteriaceae archaeon]
MVKTIKMTPDEGLKYLDENLKIHDYAEISYNRIFAEGEILNIDKSKNEFTDEPGFKVLVSLDAESINSTVEIDLLEFKEDLVEFLYKPQNAEPILIEFY